MRLTMDFSVPCAPGIILESENKHDASRTQQKTIDLLDLATESDRDTLDLGEQYAAIAIV